MGRCINNNKSGLYCIAVAVRILGYPLDISHLRHHFGGAPSSADFIELARIVKDLGFNAKIGKVGKQTFTSSRYPLVVQRLDGQYIVLVKYNRIKKLLLVQACSEERAYWVSPDEILPDLQRTFISITYSIHDDSDHQHFGFSWFAKAALKYRAIFQECILASMCVQVFALLSPLVFMIVIDKVLANNSLSTLDVLVFALIVVSAFEIILNSLRSYLLSHTASRIDLVLGLRLFKHLMTLPLSYFETRQVGDTIARVRELESVRHFITGSGITLFLDLIFVGVFLFVMFLFSPFLSLLVVASLPFLFGASFILTPMMRKKFESSYETNAENQSFLVETITGIETIKASAAEPKIRDKWEEKLTRHVMNSFQGGWLANLVQQATSVVSKILSVLLLWFGAREVLQGDLTVGQLIAFNMLSSRVVAPVLRLSQVWKEVQEVNVSIARIADIFDCPSEPGFNCKKVSLPGIKGEVVFNKVTFRYERDGADILHDVSFQIKPGEVVGIVGSTGSGKTTLVKLVQRFYVPQSGRIYIDGVDIAMADVSWLRRQVGVVVQDGLLFNGTIRENITLNVPDLEIEKVMAAAELAGAHKFIMRLRHGYDTQVGERGLQLSTGQRQRLAIARALAANPRMLILDEATSSLDYESEMFIQENMKDICSGRTVFIIAHRLSTVRHADRIITLENGTVIEDDTPEILLGAGGRYATLHAIQEGCHA